jgi:hypothetical protein
MEKSPSEKPKMLLVMDFNEELDKINEILDPVLGEREMGQAVLDTVVKYVVDDSMQADPDAFVACIDALEQTTTLGLDKIRDMVRETENSVYQQFATLIPDYRADYLYGQLDAKNIVAGRYVIMFYVAPSSDRGEDEHRPGH